jgi:hypothetical protein
MRSFRPFISRSDRTENPSVLSGRGGRIILPFPTFAVPARTLFPIPASIPDGYLKISRRIFRRRYIAFVYWRIRV